MSWPHGSLMSRPHREYRFPSPLNKDYDAIVDVWSEQKMARFALEYERTLKNSRQYERVRRNLERDQSIGCVLYLTAGDDMPCTSPMSCRVFPSDWPSPLLSPFASSCSILLCGSTGPSDDRLSEAVEWNVLSLARKRPIQGSETI